MKCALALELKRRWTPQRVRPKGNMKTGYDWGYLYAVINPAEGQLQAWLMPDMQKNTFLDDFSAELKVDTLLLIDGAPAHRARLKLQDNLKLQLLPAYSPELNPVERLFQEMRKALSNQVFTSLQQVESLLAQALKPYFSKPEKLKQLTLYPWMRPENKS